MTGRERGTKDLADHGLLAASVRSWLPPFSRGVTPCVATARRLKRTSSLRKREVSDSEPRLSTSSILWTLKQPAHLPFPNSAALTSSFNKHGYANSASIEEINPQDFRAQIEANLFGVVNVTRAALREKINRTQPGGPARGTRIIVDVIRARQLPRRLVLGAQAVVRASV